MDTNNNRTVKLMIGGIAIVIAIALILLFVIWSSFFGDVSNENTAETITSNLGNYVQKEYKRDEVVVKYLQEIVLEGNPVLNVTESLKYIKNLPLKGTITNLTNFYPKTPLTHNTMKSSDMLSSDNFKILIT